MRDIKGARFVRGRVAGLITAMALLLLLAVAPSGWAQQQQDPQATFPRVIEGNLTRESERTDNGRYVEAHSFRVPNPWRAGEIVYAGNGFQPVLTLRGPNNESVPLETLIAPTTTGEGRDTVYRGRLRYVAATRGTYRLEVSSAGDGETGNYRLRITLDDSAVMQLIPDRPHAVRWPGLPGEEFVRRFRVQVPDEIERVSFELTGSMADADLHVNHGGPIGPLNRLATSTWKATRPDGEERLVLHAGSHPPLRPGWLYVYVPLWNEQGRMTPGPDEATLAVYFEQEPRFDEIDHQPRQARYGINDGKLHTELPRRLGRYVETWHVQGNRGSRLEVDVRAETFDATLRMTAPDGTTYENAARSESNRNPRLVQTLESSGNYTIEVSSRHAAVVGGYTLGIFHDGATFATPQRVSTGIFKGQLSSEDTRLRSGEYVDWYGFDAEAGEIYTVSLVSYHLNGYLFVRPPGGANHDNARRSASDRNPFSRFTVSETGTVVVGVTSDQPSETGPYRLYIERHASPRLGGQTPTRIQFDEVYNGTLATNSPQLPDGRYAKRYALNLDAGTGARVAVVSEDLARLDAVIEVLAPDGLRFVNEAAHAETRSPLAEWRAHVSGLYYITVTSTTRGMRGNFRLRAVRVTTGLNPSVPARAASEPRFWGIFAGATEYDSPTLESLPLCREDAKRVARAYRDAGAMTSHNQIVLLDKECTAEAIRHAFERLATQVAPGDVFVFFFSGHGGQSAADSDPSQLNGRREAIITADASWIYDTDFNDLVNKLHDDALKVIALDACYSGGFARQVISAPNRVGFFSSEMDLSSMLATRLEFGGYLSALFYSAVRGNADRNEDGKITVGELKDYLVRRFAELDVYARDNDGNRTRQTLVYERGAVPPNAPFLRLRQDP